MFSYELTLLTFSVSYLWIISYIYIYIRSAFYVFSVRKVGGGAVDFGSLLSFIIDFFVFSVMTSISSVETPVDLRRLCFRVFL